MSAPSDSARCAFAGCKLPRLMGQVWCVEHKPKPLTFKESVASGRKFEVVKANAVCPACQELADFDKGTGLCLLCWRVYRFSTLRQTETP